MFSGCPSVCVYVSVPVCVRAFAPKHFLSTSSCFLFSLPIYFHCLHPLQVKIAILGTGGADEVQFPEAGLRFPVGI